MSVCVCVCVCVCVSRKRGRVRGRERSSQGEETLVYKMVTTCISKHVVFYKKEGETSFKLGLTGHIQGIMP